MAVELPESYIRHAICLGPANVSKLVLGEKLRYSTGSLSDRSILVDTMLVI